MENHSYADGICQNCGNIWTVLGSSKPCPDARAKAMKPKVKLIGKDGNAFFIIGLVAKGLRDAGQPEKAKEFTTKAFAAGYDALLQLAMEYADIS
jgi:hypothetical protein